MGDYVAHIAEDGRIQTVDEHLQGVADLARSFADKFGCGELGFEMGRLHDIGKCSEEFQERILHNGSKCDHATAGAGECAMAGLEALGICISGHHGGLPDGGSKVVSDIGGTYIGRMLKFRDGGVPHYEWNGSVNRVSMPKFYGKNGFTDSFLIRMLYSCLVDADFLDTETFMNHGECDIFGDTMQVLLQKYLRYIGRWSSPVSPVDKIRTQILDDVCDKGGSAMGLYSMIVPTGGGKTTASLGFALQHAVKHGLDRIIYVVLYTSIIEQNADVFRKILGDGNVLEFHSGYEGDEDGLLLSSDNWDVPVVVTTTVAFFESFVSNKPSKCRKLHNISNSVVIFDEAQLFPIQHLSVCTSIIAELVKHYRVTAVLCTATCPDFSVLFKKHGLGVVPLIKDVDGLFQSLRRTNLSFMGMVSDNELVDKLSACHQVLCIVNTKKTAYDLYGKFVDVDGVYHLSTHMYANHRREVLSVIRKRLLNGERCIVISTSLVEAGVDIDFPVVYRELIGLDSVLQAAGRCNRHGLRSVAESPVMVFELDNRNPNLFSPNIGAMALVRSSFAFLDESNAVEAYFKELYRFRGYDEMDVCRVVSSFEQNTWDGVSNMLPFKSVAGAFHLIQTNTVTLYVENEDTREWIRELRSGHRSKRLFRKLSQYSISVYPYQYQHLYESGYIELIGDVPVLWDVTQSGVYSQDTGLICNMTGGQAIFI